MFFIWSHGLLSSNELFFRGWLMRLLPAIINAELALQVAKHIPFIIRGVGRIVNVIWSRFHCSNLDTSVASTTIKQGENTGLFNIVSLRNFL